MYLRWLLSGPHPNHIDISSYTACKRIICQEYEVSIKPVIDSGELVAYGILQHYIASLNEVQCQFNQGALNHFIFGPGVLHFHLHYSFWLLSTNVPAFVFASQFKHQRATPSGFAPSNHMSLKPPAFSVLSIHEPITYQCTALFFQTAGGAGTPTAHLCYCVHLTLSEGQFISLLPVSQEIFTARLSPSFLHQSSV